jgi:hypothetical protein
VINKEMNFQINPCKAVMEKVATSDCDINEINNLCYGVCNSFGRVYGADVRKKCDDKCADMISRKKKDLGTNDCYKRQPLPPPTWFQVPDNYPELLNMTQNPKKAYEECCSMCEGCSLPNECREKCRLNAGAVVTHEKYKANEKVESRRKIKHKRKVNYEKHEKKKPWVFLLVFSAVIVLMVLLVYMLVRVLYKDKL